nr:immunoglobulin heavy chain junction region [Macaca mulatta]
CARLKFLATTLEWFEFW